MTARFPVHPLRLAALATGLLLLPGLARAEIVASAEGGFVSRHAAVVGASPADAWRALVAPAGWWNGEHTYSGDAANLWIDSQATGCFCEKLPPAKGAPEGQRPGSIEHMRIVYAQPGMVLRMTGGLGPLQSEAVSATLTITLKPVPEGTRILWEYAVGGYMRYKTDEIGPLVDGVLGEQLARLAARLGSATGPAADEGSPAAGKPEAAGGRGAPAIVAEPLAGD